MERKDFWDNHFSTAGANFGAVIWLCGLSGAGKTTLNSELVRLLRQKYHGVLLLDGDILRSFSRDFDYTRAGRIESAKAFFPFLQNLAAQGFICCYATISMFNEIYLQNRQGLKNYYEIYVKCDLDELFLRDQKGLYSGVKNGTMRDVVGLDIKYDEPSADFVIDNSQKGQIKERAELLYERVCEFLDSKNITCFK